jgi:hypothetical protein
MSEPILDPVEVSSLSEDGALERLDRWESSLAPSTLAEIPSHRGGSVLVLGDTHADWPTSQELVRRFLSERGPDDWLVALGDYVDRSPFSLPLGSLRNALFWLSVRAAHPDRVVLLRGNHETQRQIPGPAQEVLYEASERWGSSRVGDRIEDLFDRLPLAAVTENGAYLAHAGFPMTSLGDWRSALRKGGEALLLQVVWNDVAVSPTCGNRGIDQEPISPENLTDFFARSGTSVFVRGHDPAVAGKFLFDRRLLTLQSTRVYPRAGLTLARLPLGERLRVLEPAFLERREFPPIPSRVA